MKVTIARLPFLAALKRASGVAPVRPANPVTQNVRLEAVSGKGAGLYLRSTDLDIELRETLTEVEVKEKEKGVALAPAKRLHDLVRDLDCDAVTLELVGSVLNLTGAGDRFELNTTDPAEFPADVDEPAAPTVTMLAADMAEGFRVTAPHVAPMKNRYALNSVCVVPLGDMADFFGTDGRKCSIRRLPAQGQPVPFQVLIPPRLAEAMARLCAEAEKTAPAVLRLYENRTLLQIGQQRLGGLSVYGEFPKPREIGPEALHQFKVSAGNLKAAMTRARHMSEAAGGHHGVTFELETDMLVLRSASPMAGKATIRCEVAYQGEPAKFCLGPEYVLDGIDVMAGLETLTVAFVDADTCFQIHGGDPENRNYLLEPVEL